MSSIIPHLPTCLFPCSHDINSGVKGRLRVVIRVEYKSITSFYDSATTFVGGVLYPALVVKSYLEKKIVVCHSGLLKSCFLCGTPSWLLPVTRLHLAGSGGQSVPLSFILIRLPLRTLF